MVIFISPHYYFSNYNTLKKGNMSVDRDFRIRFRTCPKFINLKLKFIYL